jgi:signal transduction histidine kinase
MKKGYLLGVVVALFGILLMNFASAYFYFPDFRSVTQSVIDSYVSVGEPILGALFGGYGWTGFMLFERFLLFVLLISVIYVILGRIEFFENQRAVKWVISIIVPLIGIRFIDFDWLSAILLQYQILALVLTSILPFILFFFFVHSIGKDYPVLRKISWIFFIGVYVGLWNTAESGVQGSVYFWTMVAAVLGLLFDKRIETWLMAKQFAKRERWQIDSEIARINEEIKKLHKERASYPDPSEVDKHIKELELQKKYLIRHRLSG